MFWPVYFNSHMLHITVNFANDAVQFDLPQTAQWCPLISVHYENQRTLKSPLAH